MNDFESKEYLKKKFNWGAFFLGWIWGLLNNSYITLIQLPVAFIPKVGGILNLALAIYFGIVGNSWALNNKEFKSEFAFVKYQKILSLIGVLVFFTIFILTTIGFEMSALHTSGYDFTLTKAAIGILTLILIIIYIIVLPFLIYIVCKKEQ